MKKRILWLVLLILLEIVYGNDAWIEVSTSKLWDENIQNSMREDIDYMELRKALYSSKTDKPVSNKYNPYFKLARKPLESYPKKIIESFRKVKFQKTDVATIATLYGSPRHHYYKVNGFVIKKDGTFLVFNENIDIGWLFNGIDTVGKLMAYLAMTDTFAITQRKIDGRYKDSLIYRKIDNGFEIKQLDDKGFTYNRETLTKNHMYDVTLYTVTKKGELSSRKAKPVIETKALPKDFFKTSNDSKVVVVPVPIMHSDPVWAFHSEKEMVEMELNNKDMIEP